MLYKIGCNLVYPLDGAQPGPYVPVWITRGALVANRYTCHDITFGIKYYVVLLYIEYCWDLL